MAVFLLVLIVALACGLPLDHTTLFAVGVVAVIAISRGQKDQ